MLIQIYEIQTRDEARMMVDLGVDHVGSVLVSKQQWKNPELKSAIRLVRDAGRKSSLIPLFGEVDIISDTIEYYKPDIVHFCEALTPPESDMEALNPILDRQKTIRANFPGLEIMRSIPIGTHDSRNSVPSLELAAIFEPFSDWFLTDTLIGDNHASPDQDQPVKGYVGITGKTCNWRIARELVRKSRIPVVLAGGIGPQNVARGIMQVGPAGVDSCTMTNRVDKKGKAIRFKKDPDKVKTMIENARQAVFFHNHP